MTVLRNYLRVLRDQGHVNEGLQTIAKTPKPELIQKIIALWEGAGAAAAEAHAQAHSAGGGGGGGAAEGGDAGTALAALAPPGNVHTLAGQLLQELENTDMGVHMFHQACVVDVLDNGVRSTVNTGRDAVRAKLKAMIVGRTYQPVAMNPGEPLYRAISTHPTQYREFQIRLAGDVIELGSGARVGRYIQGFQVCQETTGSWCITRVILMHAPPDDAIAPPGLAAIGAPPEVD